MANLITTLRLFLLFVLMVLAYEGPAAVQLVDAPLLFLIIGLDGLDGYVARRRNETSVFGSIFDIAVDRVVENVLWVMLGHLGLVPIWVAFVFITRGAIVDSIRYWAVSAGETPFGMMRGPIGRFLVASYFMRGFYGTVKALTFGWVLLLQPWQRLAPAAFAVWAPTTSVVTHVLVLASVTLCLVRGVPVIAEFMSRRGVMEEGGFGD